MYGIVQNIFGILAHIVDNGLLYAFHILHKAAAARLIRERFDPEMDVVLEKAKIALAKWIVGLNSIVE